MTTGSKVRIVNLVLYPRTVAGISRPQIGDTGVVLRVEKDDIGQTRYTVESMGRSNSSVPAWTGEFANEELQPLHD